MESDEKVRISFAQNENIERSSGKISGLIGNKARRLSACSD